MNNLKVFVLLAGLTSLFVAIGGYFGGQSGMVLAFAFAGLMGGQPIHRRWPARQWWRPRPSVNCATGRFWRAVNP